MARNDANNDSNLYRAVPIVSSSRPTSASSFSQTPNGELMHTRRGLEMLSASFQPSIYRAIARPGLPSSNTVTVRNLRRPSMEEPSNGWDPTMEDIRNLLYQPSIHPSGTNSTPTQIHRPQNQYQERTITRPQFRSKAVCQLNCRYCSQDVCKRGMKAILLADMAVELYSTDVPPSCNVTN
jgi:sulfatase maturation enzyme AslB (radical SAM superfamily)